MRIAAISFKTSVFFLRTGAFLFNIAAIFIETGAILFKTGAFFMNIGPNFMVIVSFRVPLCHNDESPGVQPHKNVDISCPFRFWMIISSSFARLLSTMIHHKAKVAIVAEKNLVSFPMYYESNHNGNCLFHPMN